MHSVADLSNQGLLLVEMCSPLLGEAATPAEGERIRRAIEAGDGVRRL